LQRQIREWRARARHDDEGVVSPLQDLEFGPPLQDLKLPTFSENDLPPRHPLSHPEPLMDVADRITNVLHITG
jgi:hypothetical protein